MASAYTAYFDASGSSGDNQVLFVCGFVSTAEKWLRFETRWNALLKSYDISPPFHMTDFVNGTPRYEKWKANSEEKMGFFQKAINIIKTNTNKSFAIGIGYEDLQRARREYVMPTLNAPPYVWCAMGVCKKVFQWMDRNGVQRKDIELVFEKGDLHQYQFQKTCFNEWGILPLIKPKESLVAFQAADALAWEQRRAYIDHKTGKPRLRQSVYQMYRHFPNDDSWGLWDWPGLEKICKKLGQPRQVANA